MSIQRKLTMKVFFTSRAHTGNRIALHCRSLNTKVILLFTMLLETDDSQHYVKQHGKVT